MEFFISSSPNLIFLEKTQPFSENLKVVGDAQPAQLTPQLHVFSLQTSIMVEDSIGLSACAKGIGICIGIGIGMCWFSPAVCMERSLWLATVAALPPHRPPSRLY